MPLPTLLRHFIEHRKEVVVRRTRFDLRKAEERAHILEGLVARARRRLVSSSSALKDPRQARTLSAEVSMTRSALEKSRQLARCEAAGQFYA